MDLPSARAAGRASCGVPSDRWSRLLLMLVILLALALRLYRLVPLDAGLLYAQDADEGVYATTAQLALQSYVPYRDFFTPMPPVAIYLFMIVLRTVYHPWGSAVGLMVLRYSSVVCGVATVLFTYFAAKMIGGKRAGLLAAVMLAVDGIVVAQDRRAMLEAPSNMFSILAILCCLYVLNRDGEQDLQTAALRRRHAPIAASAFFCTLALLTKGTAVVSVVVVALGILARRGWRDGLYFGALLLGSYLLFASVFLVTSPQDYLKQNYVFHMLRPWDGTVHPMARLAEIWNYTWSWTTVRLAVAGVVLTLLAGRQVRNRALWGVVLAWSGLALALLLGSRTYWATYFSQLAVPFSILGGLVLNEKLDCGAPSSLPYRPLTSRHTWLTLQIAVLAVFLILGYPRLRQQYATTRAALEQTKPAYVEIFEYIKQHLPADTPILAFETNYTFLASHPPAGAREGSFFIDSYGEMLYRSLGLSDMSMRDVFSTWLGQARVGSRAVFHRQPAQMEVRRVFERAPYTVLDGRALNQLTKETTDYIVNRSQLVTTAYSTQLRERAGDQAGTGQRPATLQARR